jgi:hypothetical protein
MGLAVTAMSGSATLDQVFEAFQTEDEGWEFLMDAEFGPTGVYCVGNRWRAIWFDQVIGEFDTSVGALRASMEHRSSDQYESKKTKWLEDLKARMGHR